MMKNIFLILCLVFSNTAFSESARKKWDFSIRSDQLEFCDAMGDLGGMFWDMARLGNKKCEYVLNSFNLEAAKQNKTSFSEKAMTVFVEACGQTSKESAHLYFASWCIDGNIQNIHKRIETSGSDSN